MQFDVLIVGGGHAGSQVAISLRSLKYEGSIAIVGEEPDLPYERPPLSKEYFSGEKEFSRILIRPASYWADREIAMLMGRQVATVDPKEKVITTRCGTKISYGTLVWAAGGDARLLEVPGHGLRGVHRIRTRQDTDAFRAEAIEARKIAIIGGGYIGLEAAAVLRKSGKEVVLVETLDRILARSSGPKLSTFLADEHRRNGVDLRLGSAVEAFEGKGQVSGLRLAGGEVVAADLVLVGVGINPAVAQLRAAGAACDNGVRVDENCRTSLPDIFAVGDCAAHRNLFASGAEIRLESVQNAHDQAAVAAKTIVSQPVRYDMVPWFWSNQYDLRLQTVGLSAGYDRDVVRGEMSTRSFSILYLREGELLAVDAVNRPKDFIQSKKLIGKRIKSNVLDLQDISIPLQELFE